MVAPQRMTTPPQQTAHSASSCSLLPETKALNHSHPQAVPCARNYAKAEMLRPQPKQCLTTVRPNLLFHGLASLHPLISSSSCCIRKGSTSVQIFSSRGASLHYWKIYATWQRHMRALHSLWRTLGNFACVLLKQRTFCDVLLKQASCLGSSIPVSTPCAHRASHTHFELGSVPT